MTEIITDEEAAAMFRTALNLFRLWGVNDNQAATILNLSWHTFSRRKVGDLERFSCEEKARLSNLIGIHKALQIVFSGASRGYEWIKASNDAFGGRSALDVMLNGELTDLLRVRRYLDAESSGW